MAITLFLTLGAKAIYAETPGRGEQFNLTETKRYIFNPNVYIQNIIFPETYWKLTGPESEPYKVDRLREYQQMLKDRGITNINHLRLLASQLFSENGSLSETHTKGDHGCAVGIVQYNACSHNGMSAKRFLQVYPEWVDYKYQLRWMADAVDQRYKRFHGNIRLVIISHDSPACAEHSCRDTKAGYFSTVSKKANLFTLDFI